MGKTGGQGMNFTNHAVTEYAETVGDHHSIYDDLGLADVRGLVATLGGKIEYADGPLSLHVKGIQDFTISIPHLTSARRERFAIAHAVGHYFLHYRYADKQGELTFCRGEQTRAEAEANMFASALLMPAVPFKEAFNRSPGDYWGLAAQFRVSPAAAEVRAQVLELDCGAASVR